MKKIVVVISVAMSLLTVSSNKAQVGINLGVNIGSQPAWGPVGYDHVDYYYLPDIESSKASVRVLKFRKLDFFYKLTVSLC